MKNKYFLLLLFVCMVSALGFILTLMRSTFISLSGAFSTTTAPVEIEPDDRLSDEDLPKVFNVVVGEDVYSYYYVQIEHDDDVELVPNFNPDVDSKMIMSEHGCTSLINGSFYTPENTPVGGFIIGDDIRKAFVKNSLLDGVVYQEDGEIELDLGKPPLEMDWAMQAGPVVLYDGLQTELKIKDDKFSRRMVIAKDESGAIYFFAVFGKDSVYSGPLLSELPDVMNMIGKELGLQLVTAVNLDGGSASAFIGDGLTLNERTWIGSALCVK